MLEKLKAKEIMMPPLLELSLEDPAHRVKQLMDESDACHLPVTVNNEILGMVSRAEAVSANFSKGYGYLAALDFMKTDIIKVFPEASLRELGERMIGGEDDCLAVVGRRDELLGIVHIRDVLRKLVQFRQAERQSFLFATAA